MSEKYFVEEFENSENFECSFENGEDKNQRKGEPNTDMPSALASYIKEVNKKCPQRLTPQESIELGRIMRVGSEKEAAAARNKLIEGHLVYAIKFAHRFSRSESIPKEELIQSANIGLLKAADNYDYSRGIAFSTYAAPYLTRELVLCVDNFHRTMPLSRHHCFAVTKVKRFLDENPGKETAAEIAAGLNVSLETATSWLQIYREQSVLSLDFDYASNSNSDSYERSLTLADWPSADNVGDEDSDIERAYVRNERNAALIDALEQYVNKLERNVILLRTGLQTSYNDVVLPVKKDGMPTFEDIGNVLGCGKTRACQAFHSGIKKLQGKLDAADFTIA